MENENAKIESRETGSNTSSATAMNGGRTKQSVGFMIMLFGLFTAAVMLCMDKSDTPTSGVIMLFLLTVSLILSGFGFKTASIILTSIQVVLYIAFKIYGILVNGDAFTITMVGWILIAVICLVGMTIFASGLEKMRINNRVLRRQVDELAILDPLTGLYNLRGLYMDMQTQISYAERNGKAISLMIVKLRYPDEMKALLKKDQFNAVVKSLGKLLCDTVRLEDKVYSIGADGKFSILLTCDKNGCKLVENRIRNKIDKPEWLEGISNKPIRGEVKIGYIEYSKEKLNRDVGGFLASVEEEVDYDV